MSFPSQLPSDVQFATGRGGWVQVDPTLYVVTWNNNLVADLTPHLIDMSVTHDTSRTAGNWILEATITYDGWLGLRPFVDWLAPYLRVTYADGTSERRQLGHYLVLDSPEHREEIGGTVRVDARDPLWLLNSQGIPDILIAPVGGILIGFQLDLAPTVGAVIDGALVPGAPSGEHLRRVLAPIPAVIGFDGPIFDVGTSRIEVVNTLLRWGADYFDLATNNIGHLIIVPRSNVWNAEPIRTWFANPPPGPFGVGTRVVDPSPAERAHSPIAEAIESQPSTADIVNEVIVVSGILSGVAGRASIGNNFATAGPIPTVVAGSTKTIVSRYATSQATANGIAMGILSDLLTENTSLTLLAEPDPTFVAMHSTIDLAIWDALGRSVANGSYVVNRVRYGMMPENPLMQIEVSSLNEFIPLGV